MLCSCTRWKPRIHLGEATLHRSEMTANARSTYLRRAGPQPRRKDVTRSAYLSRCLTLASLPLCPGPTEVTGRVCRDPLFSIGCVTF